MLFLNDNDSAMTIKPLTSTIQVNIQICVCVATDPDRAVVMFKYEMTLQSLFRHTQYP